jgi:hypothetical protein
MFLTLDGSAATTFYQVQQNVVQPTSHISIYTQVTGYKVVDYAVVTQQINTFRYVGL